jgi:hypothetical protein
MKQEFGKKFLINPQKLATSPFLSTLRLLLVLFEQAQYNKELVCPVFDKNTGKLISDVKT